MEEKKVCLLCERRIGDQLRVIYEENCRKYIRFTRFQRLIDVIVDSRFFNSIYFDHDDDLGSAYRGVARKGVTALQKGRKKGRSYHEKESDIAALRNNKVALLIEEEQNPNSGKLRTDIDKTLICDHAWIDKKAVRIENCYLLVLLNDKEMSWGTRYLDGCGSIREVIVCDKSDFGTEFAKIDWDKKTQKRSSSDRTNTERIEIFRILTTLHPIEIALLDFLVESGGWAFEEDIFSALKEYGRGYSGALRSLKRNITIKSKGSGLRILPRVNWRGGRKFHGIKPEYLEPIEEWLSSCYQRR